MDYETLIENLVFWSECISFNTRARYACKQAATAITDLLARAEAAESRCETLEKMVKEYQAVIVPGYRERAEKAERERDEAREVICARCSVLPCRGNECYWYRGQKEE